MMKTGSEVMIVEFATLNLSSDSAELDEALCPKCGASYADIYGCVWVYMYVVMRATDGTTLNAPS